MNGSLIAMVLVASGAIAGGAMYYLQVYGYYTEVEALPGEDVKLTSLMSGQPEAILYEEFQAIDAESSPLRYRACFRTEQSQALLTETFEIYDDPVPTVAPGWFECFNAEDVGAALEDERAMAFLGARNIIYGFDRVVAVTDDGQGLSGTRSMPAEKPPSTAIPCPKAARPSPIRRSERN